MPLLELLIAAFKLVCLRLRAG